MKDQQIRRRLRIVSVAFLVASLVGCGSGTGGVIGELVDRDSTTGDVVAIVEREPTEVTALTPTEAQSGRVAFLVFLRADPSEAIEIVSIEFSLKGAGPGNFNPATPALGFPNELQAGQVISGADLAGQEFFTFVWNSDHDLAELRRANVEDVRPVTARAMLRVRIRNPIVNPGLILTETSAEFFLDQRRTQTVAGGGAGDGNQPLAVSMLDPASATCDAQGNVFFADSGNNLVRRVSHRDGIARRVTTVAGNGFQGFIDEFVPATKTSINSPLAVAVSDNGDLYIAERMEEDGDIIGFVRVLEEQTGLVATVASNVIASGLAVNPGEFLFVSDLVNGEVLQFDIADLDPLAAEPPLVGVFEGFDAPTTLAAVIKDRVATLYVVDENVVKRFGVDQDTEIVVGGGFQDPAIDQNVMEIAFDPAGVAANESHIFVSDRDGGFVVVAENMEDPNDALVVNIISGFDQPTGLTLGENGDLIVVESGDDQDAGVGHQLKRVRNPTTAGSTQSEFLFVAADARRGTSQSLAGMQSQNRESSETFQDL